MSALWDWGFLDDCFGSTRIRVSDIDGFVERKGWFLAIEAKGSGKAIPTGQSIMFAALVRKGFTILVVWGESNKPEHMQVWYPHKTAPEAPVPATLDDIRDIVRRWFNWANANGSVKEPHEFVPPLRAGAEPEALTRGNIEAASGSS